jgi:copper chaperone
MMKKIMMVLVAAAVLCGCNTTAEKKDQSATEQQNPAAEWVEVTIDVGGMTCDGCEKAIKASVEKLDGIAGVESSHEEGWTKVKYDKSQTSVEDIEGKITDTGYEVKGVL